MYTVGPLFKANKSIEKRHLIAICRDLAASMPNNILFEPEAIVEGGIVYKFKHTDWYKSVRFIAVLVDPDTGDTIRIQWPHVSGNVQKDWEASRAEVFPNGTFLSTILKAFYGAPAFTEQELHILCQIFKKHGLIPVD